MIVCLGEALIDMIAMESGKSLEETERFEVRPGGAPANVAVAVARLGGRSAFIGKVGQDSFGRKLQSVMAGYGVNIGGMVETDTAKTALAFVSLRKDGEREFSFYRDPGADMLLQPDEVNEQLLEEAAVFHFGSISLASEPSRSATIHALEAAKKSNALICYDPNWRPSLWPGQEEAKKRILSVVQSVDLLKVNREELLFLTGREGLSEAVELFHEMGVPMVLVTLDRKGCFYSYSNGKIRYSGQVEGIPVEAVDTTGAGDTFVGAFLTRWTEQNLNLAHIEQEEIEETIRFSVQASSITVTRRGAMAAMPDRREVEEATL
ncbi:PfkB family carbohydrate kinase [Effusibacillus consociatus]|uniref:PfkB family carbohydrate kinase n=1 Tax=Effusibacillus consociatus TaxID=1117041 RepID=A0ABV9PXI9_9BACL